MRTIRTKELITLGLLTAVEVVLSRFCSISAWNIKIGFSFGPIAIGGILFGPLGGGLVGALGDFIGAVLFPIGPYFPGFTLTAFLTGTVFGVFLHKQQTIPRIVGAVAVNQLVLSLLLQTAWISQLYGSPYEPLLLTRVGQCAILAPLQFVTIGTMTKAMGRYWKRAAA